VSTTSLAFRAETSFAEEVGQLAAENAAMDGTTGDYYPLRVRIAKASGQSGFKVDTDLLIDQIRTVSNRHLLCTKPLATRSANHLKRVMEALRLLTTSESLKKRINSHS
jgi:hypothetical protein